jgi:Tol biopolymer transport system component
MKRCLFLLSLFLFLARAEGQIAVTSNERLPLPSRTAWHTPKFSPDGKRIYVTNEGGNGIWEFDLEKKSFRRITSDLRSGSAYTISPDGKRIAYRRTAILAKTRRRIQEIVVRDLTTGKYSVTARGQDLSPPFFAGEHVVASHPGESTLSTPLSAVQGVQVIGIENTKIALLKDGAKVLFDPLGDGRYIWPALSPDGTRIVAHAMERGTFVFDLNGNVLANLGRRNAPSWTRDGKWIVYMHDEDDGHRVISSDLYAVSPDGSKTIQLTQTANEIEMYPQCSPTENKIVYMTLSGKIYLLTYSESL